MRYTLFYLGYSMTFASSIWLASITRPFFLSYASILSGFFLHLQFGGETISLRPKYNTLSSLTLLFASFLFIL